MMKLTPALKKTITNDWRALAAQFATYKPMWLARRIGPLVQGICLDRDSSNAAYLPTLHVHCLCCPFPVRQGGLARWHETLSALAVSGDRLRQVVTEQTDALK
jgi:hypothetical protein